MERIKPFGFWNKIREKELIIQIFLLSLSVLFLYYPILKNLVYEWSVDPNYSHGFLIPLICAYIIWGKKDELFSSEIEPFNFGFILLLFAVVMLIVGCFANEFFTKRVSFIFMVLGIILFVMGKQITKVLLFPILFLIFMIPLPYILYDSIAFPLKLLASKIAANCLFFLGIPVFREGNIIHLADTTLEVADACSGIRSLMSLLALGTIFSYFTQKKWWKALILTLSAIPIAVFTNVFRVTGTGILANMYGAEAAEGFFHTFSGMLVFIVAFAFMFLISFILGKICPE